jgi:uncharacterized membrane protein (DUF106 family)
MNTYIEKFLEDLNNYSKALQELNEKFSKYMEIESDRLKKLEEKKEGAENV